MIKYFSLYPKGDKILNYSTGSICNFGCQEENKNMSAKQKIILKKNSLLDI